MFFIGYSGWDYEQLKEEIKEESWLISSLPENPLIQLKKESIWKDSLKKMGKQCAILSTFPEDPSLN